MLVRFYRTASGASPVEKYLGDLEAKERDELKGFVEDANAELAEQPQRSQQQQVLKGSQRALKESVSQIIVVGLEDIQNRMLQTDFTGMTSVVFDNSKAGLQRKPEVASARWLAQAVAPRA